MPTRNLPNSPRLEHLKNQAKSLLKQVRAEDPEAVALAAEFHPVSTLADAQVAIARSYGFASWPRLVHHLELVDRYSRSPHQQPIGGPLDTLGQRIDEFLKLATLHYGQDDPARQASARTLLDEVALSNIYTQVVAGEVEAVRATLAADPSLARREGGPLRWEPLVYLTYSRLEAPAGAATTSLHQAAFRGHLDTVKKLIELGADPTVEDPNYHSTPRGWAEHNHQQEVVDYLDSLKD